jgi:hemerythrin-like domain-containing protein
MQARGPLMIEHRLIERMIALIKKVLDEIPSEGRIDPIFVDGVVDFVRIYADQTHHGKEEGILFRKLDRLPLSVDDRRVMNELIEEHVVGRVTTKALVEANTRYRNGDKTALADITDRLKMLIDFYPKHIEKEDKVFFPASRAYFTNEEDQAMLLEFFEFDGKMIHVKYRALVDGLESIE